jgi:septal ring factor EnvC (AmiA/AmiB activator)
MNFYFFYLFFFGIKYLSFATARTPPKLERMVQTRRQSNSTLASAKQYSKSRKGETQSNNLLKKKLGKSTKATFAAQRAVAEAERSKKPKSRKANKSNNATAPKASTKWVNYVSMGNVCLSIPKMTAAGIN